VVADDEAQSRLAIVALESAEMDEEADIADPFLRGPVGQRPRIFFSQPAWELGEPRRDH
jgi:hypothetical protein